MAVIDCRSSNAPCGIWKMDRRIGADSSAPYAVELATPCAGDVQRMPPLDHVIAASPKAKMPPPDVTPPDDEGSP